MGQVCINSILSCITVIMKSFLIIEVDNIHINHSNVILQVLFLNLHLLACSPLYDWEQMEKDKYSWWIRRVKRAANLYDEFRIDHFRGFAGYWAVPAG